MFVLLFQFLRYDQFLYIFLHGFMNFLFMFLTMSSFYIHTHYLKPMLIRMGNFIIPQAQLKYPWETFPWYFQPNE